MKTLSSSNNLNLFSRKINKTIRIIKIDLKILEEDLGNSNNDVSEEKKCWNPFKNHDNYL